MEESEINELLDKQAEEISKAYSNLLMFGMYGFRVTEEEVRSMTIGEILDHYENT